MRLDDAQKRNVEEQLGVAALPEEHPVMSDLKEIFGDHTFFLDAAGLNIVEPNQSSESSNGSLVRVASWANDERTELRGQEPEVLSTTVEFDSNGADPAA